MAGQDMEDLPQEGLGKITVNDDVVAHIASIAIGKVEGVASVSGKSTFGDFVGSKSKDVDKGVTVKMDEARNQCRVNVDIKIEYGLSVYDTARKLQQVIKNELEEFTGLTVSEVNVTIRELMIYDDPRGGAQKTNRAA